MKAGDWVTVTANSPADGSLLDAINANAPGFTGRKPEAAMVKPRILKFTAQIVRLGAGTVTLTRPLHLALPLAVGPELHK